MAVDTLSPAVVGRGAHWRRLAATSALVVTALAAMATPSDAGATPLVRTIVRADPGADQVVASTVAALGGTVERHLDLIGGFVVDLPASVLDNLARAPGVASVVTDGRLQLLGESDDQKWKSDVDLGSYYMTTKSINAHDMWSRSDKSGAKYTGQGIGVAVIDSGVVAVEGLNGPGKVINGPDLSFESQSPDARHLDTFGHGTHIAGIIAGRDRAVKAGNENDSKYFVGVAPGAHIISVKVAASDGATDVSQVIAAIDWVVTHRNDPGLNIKVLNLSFGTTALQSYELDPLSFAVEAAWHHGIVVVVAAGNDGPAGTTLNNPAIDPYVIAVGASDHAGTEDRKDDSVATFSSVGNAQRAPDLIAPGRSIVSLRDPASWIDEHHPEARVDSQGVQRFFRGSGTSQAAAVVSGSVALVLDERPGLTPDQVKFVLQRNATRVAGPSGAQGAGLLQLKDIQRVGARRAPQQSFPRATGVGSLEAARGDSHVADPESGVELVGEVDIFGHAWDGSAWAAQSGVGAAWSGGAWNGTTWTGPDWGGSSWTGKTWRAGDWLDGSWTGKTWRDAAWTGKTWRDASWTGKTWRDAFWTGTTWRGDAWSGADWS